MPCRIPQTSIRLTVPIKRDLDRLKLQHGGCTYGELISHLILKHDIAQDKRERIGRGPNMAKVLLGQGNKLHAHLGRPKRAKDLKPRKTPQRKLKLVVEDVEPGSYRKARGVFPWTPNSELPERL